MFEGVHATTDLPRRASLPLLPLGPSLPSREGNRFGNPWVVRIISTAAITEFRKTHRDALESLLHWHFITKRAAWRHLADVRADFSHAGTVDACTVFHISGNRCRLIPVIKYRWQIVCIRHILTHDDYDNGRWRL